MKPTKLISVVTPCYNEETNVGPCYEAIRDIFAARLPSYDFEHIFADNNSRDNTVGVLRGLAAKDCRVKVILNSRNFGPMRSNFNALLRCSGDAIVVCVPADLQDPPALIPEFVERWENGFQIVYGIRKNRRESWLLRNSRALFYRIINRLSELAIPEDAGEFQLIDQAVLKALRGFDDYYPYIRGMIAACGFRSCGIAYDWGIRERGLSKATSYGLVDQALNALISFSNVPVRICLFGGLVLTFVSAAYFLIQLVLYLAARRAGPDLPAWIVAQVFFGGLNLFFLGVLGEYINAVQSQVRKRPLVIEKETINF